MLRVENSNELPDLVKGALESDYSISLPKYGVRRLMRKLAPDRQMRREALFLLRMHFYSHGECACCGLCTVPGGVRDVRSVFARGLCFWVS